MSVLTLPAPVLSGAVRPLAVPPVPLALVLSAIALLLALLLVRLIHRRRRDVSPSLAELAEAVRTEAQPESRELRVLRRQVDVLTATLQEWDQERHASPAAPTGLRVPGAPAGESAGTAYAGLSRRLAGEGDLGGAVLAQWACDLEVLRGPLVGHETELADALVGVWAEDPVAVLRVCRETAITLTAAAGTVHALLAPLDHLVSAAFAPNVRPRLPQALVAEAPELDRPALARLVAVGELP